MPSEEVKQQPLVNCEESSTYFLQNSEVSVHTFALSCKLSSKFWAIFYRNKLSEKSEKTEDICDKSGKSGKQVENL